MTKNKRFEWHIVDGDIVFYEDGAMMDYDDVVALLNKLYKDNIDLKEGMKRMMGDMMGGLI